MHNLVESPGQALIAVNFSIVGMGMGIFRSGMVRLGVLELGVAFVWVGKSKAISKNPIKIIVATKNI